jgi:hypothetical protein
MRNPEFTPVKNGHRAKILYFDGRRIRIDFLLAPLIQALHTLGIETTSCCQGSCAGHCRRRHYATGKPITYTNSDGTKGSYRKKIVPKRCQETAYIAFPTPAAASKFLNIVYDHKDPEELRFQIRGEGGHPNTWIWDADIDGCVVESENRVTRRGCWVTKPKRPFNLTIGMLCMFPRAHLTMVTDRVQKVVEKAR